LLKPLPWQSKKIRQKAGEILGVVLDYTLPDGKKVKHLVKEVSAHPQT